MDESQNTPSIDLKGRSILVVDDDRVNLKIIGGILRHEGYEITEAASGEQALEVYAEFRPNLVLLDVMMPGIDGFATCRTLKKTYGETCAPVIFVTARSKADDIVMGFDAGGVDYLTKPFRPKEVLARIRTHLSNQLLLEQLSKANAAKDRFLGMCAHDLRNPLSSIRGLAELMSENAIGSLTEEQREIVNTIHGASQSMLQLVNELLDVATIEAGHLKLAKEPTRIADIVNRSIRLSGIEAAKKNTRIEMVNKTKNPMIDVDRNKIRQVVDNLINNAVKYSPRGSLITVKINADETSSGFSVIDNGPGIPDNERHKLFKDYGRLSAQPTGGEKSTGLGLAICRKIVEAHRGTISVENTPGRGCEFVVRLPRFK
ncbi:MAG: hybrid sensor histidine kinase/response regulator [Opitutaceae bacterium]|jgi:signal transduction histidine kinase